MKVGDLVCLVVDIHGVPITRRHDDLNRLNFGMIIAYTDDPLLGTVNGVFKVLWNNGTIGKNVWGCDLRKINTYENWKYC